MPTVDASGVPGEARGRIQRTAAYAEQVRKMFAATVNAMLTLKVTPPDISNGEMYSYDGQNIRIRQQVEQLLRHLHSIVVVAIEKGISLEWDKAQEASNALLKRVYDSKLLNSNVMRGWNSRNNAAQEAFIKRSDNGMNLSQRVWKSCRQLRDEMEIALTVSIGEGEDAGTISRRVRQYLNDPDLMFRRFRYKVKEPMRDDKGNIVYGPDGKPKMQDKLDADGNPIWAKKWKKKVIDHTTGKVTFIDYDKDTYKDQWTGKGYYKSAAQNAMRVARTETNIAYRRADCERWKQLDFVLGMRVELSHNHPEIDICDELKGDYPKDFIFDGWHPQCFCHAVPILIDPEEMRKRNEAIARGEEYTPKGKPITDVPQGFKDWCIENQEKILASRVRGKEPYFVRNNFDRIDRIINPQNYKPAVAADIDGNETPVLTTAQIAAKRIAARTPEYIAEVKERWENHRLRDILNKYALTDDEKKIIREVISDTSLTKVSRDTKISNLVYDSVTQNLMPIAARYSSQSKVIDDLYDRITSENNPIELLSIACKLKEKCAVKTRWDLKKWGVVPNDKVEYVGIVPNYIINKKTRLTTSTGVDVDVKDLVQDLIEFKDKRGLSYYYPIGINRYEVPISAGDAVEAINDFPKYIQENLKGVILTNKPHPLDDYFKVEYSNFTRGYMYSSDPVTVHIRYDKTIFAESLTHEVGHHIDLKLNWRNDKKMQDKWQKAVYDDGGYVTKYAKSSPEEDFAESIKYFVHHYDWFKKNFPNRYKIMKRLIGKL